MEAFGFALCCGRVPVLESYRRASCPVCGRERKVLGAGPPFLRQYWNVLFNGPIPRTNNREDFRTVPTPRLHGLPAGWRNTNLNIHFEGWGYQDTVLRMEGGLFFSARTPEQLLIADGEYECGIGYSRHLHSFQIATTEGNILSCELKPCGKRMPCSYAYASRGYSTDGTWWFNLNIHAGHVWFQKMLRKWLETVQEAHFNRC